MSVSERLQSTPRAKRVRKQDQAMPAGWRRSQMKRALGITWAIRPRKRVWFSVLSMVSISDSAGKAIRCSKERNDTSFPPAPPGFRQTGRSANETAKATK